MNITTTPHGAHVTLSLSVSLTPSELRDLSEQFGAEAPELIAPGVIATTATQAVVSYLADLGISAEVTLGVNASGPGATITIALPEQDAAEPEGDGASTPEPTAGDPPATD